MFVPLLVGLIVLIAVFAIGLAVGGLRRGLAAASNHYLPSTPPPSEGFAVSQRTGGTNSLPSTHAQSLVNTDPVRRRPAADSLNNVAAIHSVMPSRSVGPVKITPSNGLAPVNPSPVVNIKQTIAPCKAVIVRPQEMVVIRPSQAFMVTPSPFQVTMVAPSRATTVEVPERGAWDERGWTKNTNGQRDTFDGYYLVAGRQFRGRVEAKNRGREIAAYIFDPPREIKRHAHGACFQQVGNGWFILHWARPARNVDDAILYMEKVLDESINR